MSTKNLLTLPSARANIGKDQNGKNIYKLRDNLKPDELESPFKSSFFEGNPTPKKYLKISKKVI